MDLDTRSVTHSSVCHMLVPRRCFSGLLCGICPHSFIFDWFILTILIESMHLIQVIGQSRIPIYFTVIATSLSNMSGLFNSFIWLYYTKSCCCNRRVSKSSGPVFSNVNHEDSLYSALTSKEDTQRNGSFVTVLGSSQATIRSHMSEWSMADEYVYGSRLNSKVSKANSRLSDITIDSDYLDSPMYGMPILKQRRDSAGSEWDGEAAVAASGFSLPNSCGSYAEDSHIQGSLLQPRASNWL